jgi:hypothetical protein
MDLTARLIWGGGRGVGEGPGVQRARALHGRCADAVGAPGSFFR